MLSEYDALGNITRVYDKKTGTNKAAYTYNDLGQRMTMTDSTGTTTYTTDQYGNLLTESKGDILKTYTYDINGNKATFTLADGGAQKINSTYAYDNLTRLTSVTDTGISAEYSYDANGNLTQKSVNGNVIAEYTYNQGNMPITLTNTIGDTTKTYTTTYYLDGNKKSEGTCAEDMRTYKYDVLDELTEEVYVNKYKREYEYGEMNTRDHETYTDLSTNKSADYSYGSTPKGLFVHRIHSGGAQEASRKGIKAEECGRDDNGNIDWRRRYDYDWATIKSYTYTYDSYNRMISSSNDGVVTTYTYDGDNLRQSKTTNGVTTTHVYDGSDIVYEKKGNDTYVYIRGLELISSKKNDGEYEYYHHDVHGNVIAKTDANGQIEVYEYDAFGNMESTSTADTENPFKYCGEYVDEETGFVYLRNRYYDPSIGCFTTIDPAKDGLNWYVYCGNNPVNAIDPLGLFDYNSRLQIGSRGNDVKVLQNELKYLNCYSGEIDGIFGKQTQTAVNKYKSIMGFGNSGKDAGVVGLQTWSSMGLIHRTQADINAGVETSTIGLKQYKNFSIPINNALDKATSTAKNLNNAFKVIGFMGQQFTGKLLKGAWFLSQVYHERPWDIKRENSWNDTIGKNTYPGYSARVIYNNNFMTPEELGNYTYGYIGNALGFNLTELYCGSWAAAGFPISGNDLSNEFKDWPSIKKGYSAY